MNGCIYRTKDGECDLYAEGGKYQAFCDMDNCEGRKLSNADRIRAMTDEELAEWVSEIADCVACEMQQNAQCRYHHKEGSCSGAWLDWLKQEAQDD